MSQNVVSLKKVSIDSIFLIILIKLQVINEFKQKNLK